MQLGESYILALHCRPLLLDSGKYNHIRSRIQSLTLHKDLAPLPSTASTARESHTSTPPQCYTFNAPPELKNSMPPRLYTCSAPAHLHTYMPPRRYAFRSAPSELQSSMPPLRPLREQKGLVTKPEKDSGVYKKDKEC